MRKKKGEITANQLIAFVLAILGFVIVLFLIASLDLDTFSKEEVCRVSVLTRATAPNTVNSLVPLKCETDEICIGTGFFGSDCKNFAGENYNSVRISESLDEQDADEISRVVADEMIDCWNMMGEGKLDLFSGIDDPSSLASQGSDVLGIPKGAVSSCVICSRIALSDDILDDEKNLEKLESMVDLNEYMGTNNPSGSEKTYLDILSGGRIRSYSSNGEGIVEFDKELTDEVAVVFSQIYVDSESWSDAAIESFLGVGGLALGTSAATIGIGRTVKLASKTGWIGGGLLVTGIAGVGVFSAVRNIDNHAVAEAYCGSLTSTNQDRKGCSVVSVVPYNVQNINQLCSRIEGEL